MCSVCIEAREVERAAEALAVVDKNDFGSGCRSGECRAHAGCAPTDDRDIGKAMKVIDGCMFRAALDPAESGHTPNDRFPKAPRAARPIEGVIVEAYR